jgi:hypothetical protein
MTKHASIESQPTTSQNTIRYTMRAFTLTLGFVVSLSSYGFCQQLLWSENYGGQFNESGNSGSMTVDGGFIAIGSTFSYGAGDHDIYVIRTDSLGVALWNRTYGGALTDYGYDIQQTADGGFILVGMTRSSGEPNGDLLLLRIDSSGAEVWSKTFGGDKRDEGWSIRLTSDGGFIICGITNSFGAGFSDMYFIRTDSLGNTLWSKTFGGAGGDTGTAVRIADDGSFFAIGSTGSFGLGYSSVYLVHISAAGDSLWANTYGDRADFGYSLEITRDGGLALAGSSQGDMYLVRTDATGFVMWETTFGGFKDDRAYTVRETPDGGFLIGGVTESFGAGKIDIQVLRVDRSGWKIWSGAYGGAGSDYCRSMTLINNQDVIIVGHSWSFSAGGSDMYVLKVQGDALTDVQQVDTPILPTDYSLGANYPNPFNPATTIPFEISRSAQVKVAIYNILVQRLITLVDERLSAGSYTVQWDGKSSSAESVASGVYFYRLDAVSDNNTQLASATRKMILLK